MSRAVQPITVWDLLWAFSAGCCQVGGFGFQRTGKVQHGCGPCKVAQGGGELLLQLIQAAQVSAAFPAKNPFPKVI